MPTLPVYRMSFEPADAASEVEDDLGLRSRLGGAPQWQQNDDTPQCSHCGKAMTFVAQLDSIHHDSPRNPHCADAVWGKQQYMFGDVGLLYIFFCFDCSEPRAVFQWS